MEYLKISEVNNYIKNVLDKDMFLNKVYLKGEISNFKNHTRGHLYFTLKDDTSRLSAVMFYGNASKLTFTPEDGMNVLVEGRISAYPAQGSYQIYIDRMTPDGLGALYIEYEKLKKELLQKGLFNEEHKKKIPRFPEKIGVITASTGAAVRDIMSTIKRRYPVCEAILFPCLVQGNDAAKDIVRQIKRADEFGVDTIIVGRGGGSIEDLWAFNEERTVRAVAASKIPIVSAVGHETDFTLCDFAADVRAATPSQAAELVVTDVDGCRRQVEYLMKRCQSLMRTYLMNIQHKVDSITSSWTLKDPEKIFAVQEQRIDTAKKHIADAMQEELSKRQQAFALAIARMDSLSPLAVLGRGYTVTQKEDYTLVKSTAQINWGDELITTVADGKIISLVQQIERR